MNNYTYINKEMAQDLGQVCPGNEFKLASSVICENIISLWPHQLKIDGTIQAIVIVVVNIICIGEWESWVVGIAKTIHECSIHTRNMALLPY